MKILALDTSATACSIAILVNDEIYSAHKIAPMQQAQLVLPLIDELLKSHNLKLGDMNALAFGSGPGSFTGVRIAASVMQGFAYATKLPLIKISSLAATAQAAFDDFGWKKLLVGMDARISEVYWGIYQINAEGLTELQDSEILCLPQNISTPKDSGWYAIGSAWQMYSEALIQALSFQPLAIDATRLPLASAIARIAKSKFLKKDFCKPEDALPAYLRDNVAEKGK
jgi:tRNA threonylcarbamoyladenosine biosynthesis protein TsaB